MIQKILNTVFILSLFTAALPALADDASIDAAVPETKTKTNDVTPAKNATPGADVDDLITNNNLRALSGSKSRWSIASQFDYLGGTIATPLAQDRPDISGASGNTQKSDLDGAISAKYNINPTNAILAGIGIRWIAPLAMGQLQKDYPGTVFDAMNPYVTYQYVYKWLGIQSVLQGQFMQWTQADQTAIGAAQQVSFDQENVYEIGKTKLSVGASIAGQYNIFNKTGSLGTPGQAGYISDLTAVQSLYAFTVAPFLEYQLSSKFNLRTLVNLFTYEHYVNPALYGVGLYHDAIYQSVGVGYALTRDIFLYPNVQFLPGQIASNLTNVGITATINLF